MLLSLFLLSLLGGLLYFLFQTIKVIVTNKGSSSINEIPIGREQVIPFSCMKIKHSLLAYFEDRPDEEVKSLKAFFDKLESVLDFKYTTLSTKLQNDFEILDPAVDPSDYSHITSEQIQEIEDRFLHNWETALIKANFKPLTQEMFDFALQEDYLNTLPLECEWERLDNKLLSRYLNNKSSSEKEGLAEHSDKIWIYTRGVGVDRCEDQFLLQKIDLLFIKFLTLVWNRVIYPIISKISPASVANMKTTSSSSLRNSSVISNDKSVKRMTLKEDLEKKGLWAKSTIQEPTFKEVFLLYRLKSPNVSKSEAVRNMVVEGTPVSKNNNAIYLKSFRDIPMADLEMLFPEKRVLMKPADLIKFSLAGLIAIISAIVQIQSDISPSWNVTLAGMGGFIALCIKFFYDYQSWMLYYHNSLNRALYEKNMDNHVGAILYLMEQLKFQEFKEAAIAYSFLLRYGAQTEKELDDACEKFLSDLQKEKGSSDIALPDIDFECNDAIDKLLNFKLAAKESGVYRPVPLREAIDNLEHEWRNPSN